MSRARRAASVEPQASPRPDGHAKASAKGEAETCWLCDRPLGRRVEWHHPQPKSRGGRVTVAVHPICHRTIHALFSNVELARITADGTPLPDHPEMQKFLAWIAGKPPDFHAPTRRKR